MGRAVKASMLSLAMALGVTACSNDYTVSYVYMTTAEDETRWDWWSRRASSFCTR